MIKKISAEQLKPGMFVHDLNARWLSHPFLSNTIKVSDEPTVEKIIGCGIREIYIDTDKGLDVTDAPTVDEVRQEIDYAIDQAADHEKEADIQHVPIKEELTRAKEIQQAAKQTIQHVMDDVRFGRQIETEKIQCTVHEMVESVFRNQDALLSLGRIRKTDEYTYYHSISVCALMVSFAKQMGFDQRLVEEIGIGAMLHDIGKMKIPIEILHKTDKLTEEEYEIIKKHVIFGKDILESTRGIAEASILMCAEHHERVDGTGYPEKLSGDEISVFGQMSAIVDVYDAMTSDRCYQKKMNPSEVLRKLFEWSKFHFNRNLVQRFIRCIGIYPIGTLVRLESGMLAVVINHGEKDILKPTVRVIFNSERKILVIPYDLDLSENGGDRVLSYEAPEQWDIDPIAYL
jgi:putative nucleotidyltransferase with HDIG domain